VIVDAKEGSILYGDSLGGWNVEVLDALQWWIEVHMHGKKFNPALHSMYKSKVDF